MACRTADTGAEEAHGLLGAEVALPRRGTALRLTAIAACVAALALACVALQRAGLLRRADVPRPPAPAPFMLERWEAEPDADAPHMSKPPDSEMMAIGEEGCDPKDNPDCFEGDVLLDPDQQSASRRLFLEGNATFGPQERSLYTPYNGAFKMWPEGVVKYAWEHGINPKAKTALQRGMKMWEAKTCVRFEEVQRGDGKGVVLFKSSGRGCNAHVGYSDHWEHYTNLGTGCETVGVALHELGHTIGLRHEHAREDALEYISFRLDNAHDGWRQWLSTYHGQGDASANTPYDMGSIMHYGPWAGAKDHGNKDRRTIEVKKKDVFGNCQFGQRLYLSEGDILTINRWYGCPDHFCADLHQHCGWWAKRGECEKSAGWMKPNCPHSCGECECKDTAEYADRCQGWAKHDLCARGEGGSDHDKAFMMRHCRRSCGDCLLEDVANCEDQPIWDDPESCSKYRDRPHKGGTWCENHWFATSCPRSCNLCPHQPLCW